MYTISTTTFFNDHRPTGVKEEIKNLQRDREKKCLRAATV